MAEALNEAKARGTMGFVARMERMTGEAEMHKEEPQPTHCCRYPLTTLLYGLCKAGGFGGFGAKMWGKEVTCQNHSLLVPFHAALVGIVMG